MALRTAASASSSTSSIFSSSLNLNPASKLSPFWLQVEPHKSHAPILKSLRCIQSSPPDSNPLKSDSRNSDSAFTCSAVSFFPSQREELVPSKLQCLVAEFQSLSEPIDRVKRLLHYASLLPPLDESVRVDSNRVMGCTAQVWLELAIDEEGQMRFAADSDSEITRGFCSCLIWMLDGLAPEEVLKVKTDDLVALNVGLPGNGRSRVNTWHNVLISMQKRTKALLAEREGKVPSDPFRSSVVTADAVHPRVSYAEAQAKYLFPDELKVSELVSVLNEKKIGVVAHFYMDPEVQGIFDCCSEALASHRYIRFLNHGRYACQDGKSWMLIHNSVRCGFYVGKCSCNPRSSWFQRGF